MSIRCATSKGGGGGSYYATMSRHPKSKARWYRSCCTNTKWQTQRGTRNLESCHCINEDNRTFSSKVSVTDSVTGACCMLYKVWASLTFRILISFPSKFWLLARFFLVMALMATTSRGRCKRRKRKG